MSNSRGVTLMETIIIVVAIITIPLAIAIPTYMEYTKGNEYEMGAHDQSRKQKEEKLKPDYRKYKIRNTYLYEFRLQDGTRCIAQYKGAIDCNWR